MGDAPAAPRHDEPSVGGCCWCHGAILDLATNVDAGLDLAVWMPVGGDVSAVFVIPAVCELESFAVSDGLPASSGLMLRLCLGSLRI